MNLKHSAQNDTHNVNIKHREKLSNAAFGFRSQRCIVSIAPSNFIAKHTISSINKIHSAEIILKHGYRFSQFQLIILCSKVSRLFFWDQQPKVRQSNHAALHASGVSSIPRSKKFDMVWSETYLCEWIARNRPLYWLAFETNDHFCIYIYILSRAKILINVGVNLWIAYIYI